MPDKKKPKEKEKAEMDVEFGAGNVLGGLFKGIGDLLETAAKLSQKGDELKKQGEIKFGKDIKGVYGFKIRTMAGGAPSVETFGNIKKTPQGPVVEAEREPDVDVFDEKDHILMIAEIPGVSEDDIHLEVKGDIFKLSAKTGDRTYAKEILLPAKVNADKMEKSYGNGILKIKLPKKGQ